MKLPCIATVVALTSSYMWSAQAIPAWDAFTSRENIGNLVPGTTVIHALGYATSNTGSRSYKYLRSNAEPGVEANLTVTDWNHALGPPSRFFVSKGSLFQITNHTHILYADLVNATDELLARDKSPQPTPRTAFKLRLSNKRSGLVGGTWEWFTTMLQFNLGQRSNNGLFYKCTEQTGETNIYVPLDSGKTPEGCEILSLLSFTVKSEK